MGWRVHDGKSEAAGTEDEIATLLREGKFHRALVRRVDETNERAMRTHAPFAMAIEASKLRLPPPLPTSRAEAHSSEPDRTLWKIERQTTWFGGGSLLQLFGLVFFFLPGVGAALMMLLASSQSALLGGVGFLIAAPGLLVGTCLMLWGARLSQNYSCGNCGNRVADLRVALMRTIVAVLGLALVACGGSPADPAPQAQRGPSSSASASVSSSSASTGGAGTGGAATGGAGSGGESAASTSSTASSSAASSSASSAASTGSGAPSTCTPLPLGVSTDCGVNGGPLTIAAFEQGGAICTPPPNLYLYFCSDFGAPNGFTDCYQTQNDIYAYCEHLACVRYERDDNIGCAGLTPHGWECADGNSTNLPSGCVASTTEGNVWCCP